MNECSFCNPDVLKRKSIGNMKEGDAGIEIYLLESDLHIETRIFNEGFAIYSTINYCFMCGRKLPHA